ncbi:MAG: hypothetical protein ACK4Z0_03180 [Sphingomonadaceae bacterium]
MAWLALLTSGESDPGQTPPGLVAIGGLSLVERQVAAVRAAGADTILLLAPALPPAVAARLGRDPGLVRLASAESLARQLDGEARDLLLLAPGLLAGPAFLDPLAGSGPVIAIFAETQGEAVPPEAERLDSGSFWAGTARLPAGLVASVAHGLGEWALAPTLVRAAIEAGLPRQPMVVPDGSLERLWLLPADPAGVAAAERALLAATVAPADGLVGRWLHGPAETALAGWLVPRGLPPFAGALATPLLMGLALLLMLAGQPAWSLVPLLLAGPLEGLGRRLAAARGEPTPLPWLGWAPAVLGAAWLLALAARLAPILGLSAWLAATGALLLLAATLASHRAWRRAAAELLTRRSTLDRRLALLFADPWLLAWLAAGFGLAGRWAEGLPAIAAAAALGFAIWHWRLLVAVRERLRPAAGGGEAR